MSEKSRMFVIGFIAGAFTIFVGFRLWNNARDAQIRQQYTRYVTVIEVTPSFATRRLFVHGRVTPLSEGAADGLAYHYINLLTLNQEQTFTPLPVSGIQKLVADSWDDRVCVEGNNTHSNTWHPRDGGCFIEDSAAH